MAEITLTVPDIGSDSAEVVEILVAVDDLVEAEQSLIVLESDKASMEVPASQGGTVTAIKVKEGDELKEGDAIVVVEAEVSASTPDPVPASEAASEPESEPATAQPAVVAEAPAAEVALTLTVPDIGGDSAEVVEVLVAAGDSIEEEASLIVLESDKASMEVPATSAGTVTAVKVKVGDTLSEGDAIAEVLSVAPAPAPAPQPATTPEPAVAPAPSPVVSAAPSNKEAEAVTSGDSVYAGPAVRKLAREFGIDLTQVKGSGPRGRLQKEDLHQFVSQRLSAGGAPGATAGAGIPPVPEVDFSQFGSVEPSSRSRLDKLTAANMSRAWLNVPHVTQFDDADITDLESFRKSLKAEAEKRGTKLSPLPFILKACAVALNNNPKLKSSLAEGGEVLVHKDYCHIGMAVDTPAGLMVPVIRDVDQKSLWELGAEILELAGLARDRKLRPEQMQGGVFSVSSLGNIGGRGFTPIVNAPEVAILGVSRAGVQPVWDGTSFVPRTLLPLSLSYDHRVINGGDAGRFLTELAGLLADIRRCLL